MYLKFYLLLFIFLLACSDSNKLASQQPVQEKTIVNISYLSNIKLPESLDFCGESVPLSIPEIRERAEREFYMLLQQPGQLILYIKRAGRYFPLFEKMLKENGMPDDIKYLSVAESALYMSRSTKDAVGLWQFLPGTAKQYGLIVDEHIDERRHPEKSTDAALVYLKNSYKQYKSWTLAAASYNMGHENLQSNMKHQDRKDYYDLYLNEETSRYIFRIVIIKDIMQHPAKYGFNLQDEDLYKPGNFKLVKCTDAIPDLADWAEKHGSDYKMVKLANPWILQRNLPIPKKKGYYEIAVPIK
ncbi:MAG: hypothetical protein HW421_1476 [Ignavibacteria bacterium]|nr:hypothetical protein [Ignavibacteria bacterium]